TGLITTCAAGTVRKKMISGEGDVLSFFTRNKRIHKRIQFECELRKIWEMPMDYDERLVNTKLENGSIGRENLVETYSIFFLKPTELYKYIFDDDRFQYLRDGLSGLTDFADNIENAVIQQTVFKRYKLYKWAQQAGLLDHSIFSELDDELHRIADEHRKVKRTIQNLERQQSMIENFGEKAKITDELNKENSRYKSLAEQKQEITEQRNKIKRELFPERKTRGFSYARKVAKDKLKEGEL
ncbi:MAG: hypothetical protein PHU12_04335, partial [Candidatus Aenigmarchaeota archaeon]|nr:hypothetical protein [Candidatus Aenigmarchaeota archaeon]